MTDFSDDINDLDSNLTSCPDNANHPDLQDPSKWLPYDEVRLTNPTSIVRPVGNLLFHSNMDGYLENVEPSVENPQQECFYDNSGDLIDENHQYAGMGGTANYYSGWDHVTKDPGGIYHSGGEAFLTSMEYYYDDSIVEDLYEGGKEAVEYIGESVESASEEMQSWF